LVPGSTHRGFESFQLQLMWSGIFKLEDGAVRNFDHYDESWQGFRGTGPFAGGNLYAVYVAHKSEHSFLPPIDLIGRILPSFSRNYGYYG